MRSLHRGGLVVAALLVFAGAAHAQFYMPGNSPFITNLTPPPVTLGIPALWGVPSWLSPNGAYGWGMLPSGAYAPPVAPGGGYYGPTPPSNLLSNSAPTGAPGAGTEAGALQPTAGPMSAGYGPGNPVGMGAIPRTSEALDARFESDNRLFVRWSGDAQLVSQVTFALLDRSRNALVSKSITRLPAEAHLGMTNRTAYYQVIVRYVNGTTTTFTSPL